MPRARIVAVVLRMGHPAPGGPAYERKLSGSRSYWLGAYPFSGVTRGLDSRVHPLRKSVLPKKMDCRVKPGNDEGETVPTSCIHSNGNRFSVPVPTFVSLCSTRFYERRK